MMSTQNQGEHGVIHSSIALLQERFRQLQRVKEMREKKQLLRLFSADNYKLTIPSSDSSSSSSSSSHFHLSSPITASTTTTTTTTAANNNDDDDVVMVDDDDLHIFLPPNYYHTIYSRSGSSSKSNINNKPNSSSLSHISINNNSNNQDYYPNINNSLTEISLSLWPPAISYNNANAAGGRMDEAPLSTLSDCRLLPSSCVSIASKFEDSPLVSDVDTTLHL